MKMSEKEFAELEKKIKLNSNTIKSPKISLVGQDVKATKKKSSTNKVVDINSINQKAEIYTDISDTHYSVLFKGAKLLSINQIFAILQYHKYDIFSYKKTWHNIIKELLFKNHLELKAQNKRLPFFEQAVEITIFRQAPRLVDEDALTTMFKFIIDAFKRNDNDNPYGVLAEDNPKIVHKIECYSEKGEHYVGIKIKLIEGDKKPKFLPEDILKI